MRTFLALVAAATLVGHAAQPSNPTQPNVVLIMTDDLGYGDLGSYGAPDIRTPNIDRLARRGVRFTDFYANGSSCSPTRAGLIGGRYQQRYAIETPLPIGGPASQTGLPVTGHSLPQLLRNAGYATALIGKWHLGYLPAYSPRAHGFETFFGFKSGFIDYYHHNRQDGQPDLFENDEVTTATGYMTDLITQRSLDVIAKHARQPFFLDVAYNSPHWPYQVPDQPTKAVDNGRHRMPFDQGTNTRAEYVRMVERVDQGIAQIVAGLEKHGLIDNTLLIFTNDNGGEWLSRNAPLFNRKFSLWEGGIRVPAIVSWPGRVQAGHVTPQVGITMDLTQTILAAAGVTAPAEAKFDGVNLLPVLEGKSPPQDRTLFWRINTPALNQRAVRSGRWKLMRDGGPGRPMLFDVSKDLGERNDLGAAQTDVVKRLHELLTAWEQDVDSEAKSRATASPQSGSRPEASSR